MFEDWESTRSDLSDSGKIAIILATAQHNSLVNDAPKLSAAGS